MKKTISCVLLLCMMLTILPFSGIVAYAQSNVKSIRFSPYGTISFIKETEKTDVENVDPATGKVTTYYGYNVAEKFYQDGNILNVTYYDGTVASYVCKNGVYSDKNGNVLDNDDIVLDGTTIDTNSNFIIRYKGVQTSCPVAFWVAELGRFEFVPVKGFTVIANKDGFVKTRKNEKGEDVEYFHYSYRGFVKGDKILLRQYSKEYEYIYNGKEFVTGSYKINNKALKFVDEQSKKPWTVGENYVKLICFQKTVQVPVYVVNKAPATPHLTSVYNLGQSVKVNWSATAGATEYRVYRRAGGEKSWTYLGTTGENTYVDNNVENGKSYKYTVRATNALGYSGYESGLLIKCLKAAKVKSVVNTLNGLNVTWEPVKGAVAYRVYRKTGNAASWQYMATINKTSYNDTRVATGYNFTYTIMPMGSGYYGGYDSVGTMLMRLYAPTIKNIKRMEDGFDVSWVKVPGATSYRLYRRVAGGSWVYIANINNGRLWYEDYSVESGKTYSYTVRAVNGSVMSAYRNDGPSMYCLNAPRNIGGSINVIDENARIEWEKVDCAKGYYVYRRLDGETKWTRLAKITSKSTTKYIDYSYRFEMDGCEYAVSAYNDKAESEKNAGVFYMRPNEHRPYF